MNRWFFEEFILTVGTRNNSVSPTKLGITTMDFYCKEYGKKLIGAMMLREKLNPMHSTHERQMANNNIMELDAWIGFLLVGIRLFDFRL